MRREPTLAERKLWQLLRREHVGGFKFRRQYPVRGFIVDFVCLEVGLAIEADGSQHYEPEAVEYDRRRSAVLREVGIDVIRFTDREILKEADAVANTILRELSVRATKLSSRIRVVRRSAESPLPDPPPQAGEGEMGAR